MDLKGMGDSSQMEEECAEVDGKGSEEKSFCNECTGKTLHSMEKSSRGQQTHLQVQTGFPTHWIKDCLCKKGNTSLKVASSEVLLKRKEPRSPPKKDNECQTSGIERQCNTLMCENLLRWGLDKGPEFTVDPLCCRCGLYVYFGEAMKVDGKQWHSYCFTCANPKCGRRLDVFRAVHTRGDIYCKHCYARWFGPEGFRDSAQQTCRGYRYSLSHPEIAGPLTVKAWLYPFFEGVIRGHQKDRYPPNKELCQRCRKPVHPCDKYGIETKLWHKRCFACTGCDRQMVLPTEGKLLNDNLYCRRCFHFIHNVGERYGISREKEEGMDQYYCTTVCEGSNESKGGKEQLKPSDDPLPDAVGSDDETPPSTTFKDPGNRSKQADSAYGTITTQELKLCRQSQPMGVPKQKASKWSQDSPAAQRGRCTGCQEVVNPTRSKFSSADCLAPPPPHAATEELREEFGRMRRFKVYRTYLEACNVKG